MHDVPDIHAIRVLHGRGISKREIAHTLHVSRKTVDKYTAEDYVVVAEPRMRLRQARPAPKLGRWKATLEEWMDQDTQAPRKQRRTARKLYKDLVEQYPGEVDIAEVTVRRFVREYRGARGREAFVPLEFAPGEMAEADFGHAMVVLAGQRQTLPFYASVLMYAGVRFAKVYPHEQLEAMLDGTAQSFSVYGGVPRKLMFDNASTIVRKILGGGQRLQTPEFKALQAHYGFEAVFCNPARGNEKGGVENAVRWAQRNLFSPVPEAASLEDLNAWLLRRSLAHASLLPRRPGGPLIADLWDAERGHLGGLPRAPLPACRHRFARVSDLLLVTWDGAGYSAPMEFAGKSLLLRVFWDRVELTDQGRIVAVHERVARGRVSMQLAHYLPVLERKPRAVTHAAVISQGPPAIARYRDEFLAARPEAYRELVAILRLMDAVGLDRLIQALTTASRYRTYDIASVQAVLAMDEPGQMTQELAAAHLQRWPETSVETPKAEQYAWLTEAAAGGGDSDG